MTTIRGIVVDSGGMPINGTIRATLLANMIDTATDPDSIHLPIEFSGPVLSGAIDFDLPPSEEQAIPYRITVEDAAGKIWIDTRAMIPAVGTIDLSVLLRTGFAGNLIDDSALRVAKVMAENEQLLAILRPALALTGSVELTSNAGAAVFFANPFSGDFLLSSITVRAQTALAAEYGVELRVHRSQVSNTSVIAPIAAAISTNHSAGSTWRATYEYVGGADVVGLELRLTPGGGTGPVDVVLRISEQ